MKIALVTPAAANSRYGNRNTAVRWAELLRELGHQVIIQECWNGRSADLLLALHALRKMTLFERKSLVDYALGYGAVNFCHSAVCLMTAM